MNMKREKRGVVWNVVLAIILSILALVLGIIIIFAFKEKFPAWIDALANLMRFGK
ncbi:hypothetical protein J4461_02500 [Candidatus Pacearchaeota archaeon]|nr:hypothetical protein [Candidatus Pacearchaeota archaeon]